MTKRLPEKPRRLTPPGQRFWFFRIDGYLTEGTPYRGASFTVMDRATGDEVETFRSEDYVAPPSRIDQAERDARDLVRRLNREAA